MRARRHAFQGRLALLALVLVSLAWSATKPKSPKQEPEWERLVNAASTLSRSFSPEEKADLLLDILQIPAAPPDWTRQRSLDLFAISTRQLKPSHYRAVMQKNALTVLSRVDPEKATKLYTTQDTPDMWNEAAIGEDYRAYGARTLFPSLWARSGLACLPKIKKVADWIGSTGEYPYAAIAVVARDAAKLDKPAAEALVSDAVSSFKTGNGFLDKDQEFSNFILAIQNFADTPLLREAIVAELSSLESEAKDGNGPGFMIQATDSEHKVQFNSEADYIAYRLLPLINGIDPAWADQLKEAYGVLRYLPSAPRTATVRLTGVGIPAGETASSSEIAAGMDEHRLFQVGEILESDPKQAADIAATIQDPARRAIAFGMLAPAYSKINQQQAADWLKESAGELDRLPSGTIKLRLLVQIAEGSLINGRQERAIVLFEHAFDLGEEIFEEDLKSSPGKMAYAAEGEAQLAELTESFAAHPAGRTIAMSRVEALRDDLLKAKLFVAAARGTARENSQR
jgi:hypothetical protein